MATLPEYLTEEDEESIRQRMMAVLPPDLDKAEGSYIWDSITPAAIELALAAIRAQEVLRRGFASTTFGDYLDLRCEEHGITRRPPAKATGQVKFTGAAGTVVPKGTRVATPADRATGTSSVEFATTDLVTLDAAGAGYAGVEAVLAGCGGNVPAGSISLPVTPVPGITGITNLAETSGGLDTEDDNSLLARYLQKVRTPSAGGNRADYINWAGEVAGVGGVAVIPVRDGSGTVSIAIIDNDRQPASQELVEEVLNYIADPWTQSVEAETMNIGGFGASIEDGEVKLQYNAAGSGAIVHTNINSLLDKPGIWRFKPKVKVNTINGVTDLLQLGIWNTTSGAWARVSSAPGAADAVITLQGQDLSLSYDYLSQDFYWNGTDHLEARITRLTTDNGTVVWVDLAKYVSTFTKETGDGKAPIGAAITVEAATPITINISASLTILSGYDVATVTASATKAIENYLKSLAFQGVNDPLKPTENDVKYARVANAILDTEGVEDYTNLLINGGVANITIGAQEVAIKGTVTFS